MNQPLQQPENAASNLIARQPICNNKLKVVAFELLHRMNNSGNHAEVTDGDSATIDVLLAAYNDLSIDDVVGDQLAFVNFTANILLTTLPPFPPKQLVIELLEGQEITPELIKALKKLRKKGYKIALDDFCLNKETLSLVECADIIKLDVLEESPEKWEHYIPKLKERGITMLAEKVETYDVFERCCELGFELFQGYFFAKPKVITGKKMTRNELSVINLISKLNRSDVDYDEVINIISHDADLSYNLLRTVNSGMYSFPSKIDSVRQAAVILGISHLKDWINFLSLSSLENKPQLLLDTAMTRAKMCELTGKLLTNKAKVDDYFTMGLLSIIDAFFDMPMEELLEKLSLSEEVQQALLHQKGLMGNVLKVAKNFEEANLDEKVNAALAKKFNKSVSELTQCYLDSIAWVNSSKSV